MNENLNLVKILKDCPKGTKLYSTIYGEVEIVEIRNNCTIKDPIIYKYKNVDGDYYVGSATIDGKFTAFPDGECTLFPSKNQRDWSKFNIVSKFDVETLEPFDKVLVRDHDCQSWRCDFFDSYVKSRDLSFKTLTSWYAQCIPYNEDTKHLVGTDEKPQKKVYKLGEINMKREEQIIETAKEYYNPKTGIPCSLQMRIGFITGAEWADETMIEKMCNWIDSNIDKYTMANGDKIVLSKSFKEDFIKAMEK